MTLDNLDDFQIYQQAYRLGQAPPIPYHTKRKIVNLIRANSSSQDGDDNQILNKQEQNICVVERVRINDTTRLLGTQGTIGACFKRVGICEN